jgi:hypothetical protein
MLSVVGFAVCFLFVLGFYGCVFMQLYREHRRFAAQEKLLTEHLSAMAPKPEIKGAPKEEPHCLRFPGASINRP